MNLLGQGLPLTTDGLGDACDSLHVGAAEIWALVFTETVYPNCGFLNDKRPQILFEHRLFEKLTNGRFNTQDPDISNPEPGNYGDTVAVQYNRLREAMELDESSALQSTSWGLGQVLGANYSDVGFGTPQEMVAQMLASEDAQLAVAVKFIVHSKAARLLAMHDWPNFARIYNGPAYAAQSYDKHLSSWYAKFLSGALPDLRVRTTQVYLMYQRFNPNVIDGVWGPLTASALKRYQVARGLPVTGEIDDTTYQKLVGDNS